MEKINNIFNWRSFGIGAILMLIVCVLFVAATDVQRQNQYKKYSMGKGWEVIVAEQPFEQVYYSGEVICGVCRCPVCATPTPMPEGCVLARVCNNQTINGTVIE